MAIVCPHCKHGMSLKDAKPGRYKPKCVKCSKRFLLTIFPDPQAAPKIEMLPEDSVDATLPGGSATIPAATPAPVPTPSVDATTVFEATVPGPTSTAPPPPAVKPLSRSSAADQTVPTASEATGAWTHPSSAGGVNATLPAEPSSKGTATRAATSPGTSGGPGKGSETIPERLGGYRILKELGRGAMGAVYLAKQISLDRRVALKTIQSQWGKNPTFIARFTREAYAAAQLTHHNVVQIYDLGVDAGINYFSMEFVSGESLADLIERSGKLEPEVAVGYTLQAARGLQFAHNHGMVHRDVKPANMMLNDQGVIKVADLGLVKTPQVAEAEETGTVASSLSLSQATADVTIANVAMGTPAYMAPEQAENAAGVDHRADIYSLGCSLYVLLTGRPPFQGATAWEVMTKHKTEPVVRPEMVVKDVPPALSEIVLKMVAKRPEDRYSNLGEVIAALEGFLNRGNVAPSGPTEEHARVLEECQRSFNEVPLARFRGIIGAGFVGGCLLVAAAGLFYTLGMTVGMLALLGSAVVAYFVISGLKERTFLFEKVREFLWQSRWSDWFTWIGGGLLILAVIFAVGWIWVLLGMSVVGALLGAAYYFVVDSRIQSSRVSSVERVEGMLKGLRLAGIEESAIRDFVVKYGRDDWEEFYEALFGYEAKLTARTKRDQDPSIRRGRTFRGWRDHLVRMIDRRLKSLKEQRDRKHLQRVEEAGLRAQGVSAADAKKQSQQMAAVIVDEAADTRATVAPVTKAPVDPATAAEEKRKRIKAMLAEARSGKYQSPRLGLSGLLAGPVGFLLGPKMRFLLGCALVAGCGMWLRENNLVEAATKAYESKDVSGVSLGATQPLSLPVIGRFFDGYHAGVAGIILIVSSLFGGIRMTFFALPAAVITWLGPALGVPGIAAIGGASTTSIVLGVAIAFVGLLFGRSKEIS